MTTALITGASSGIGLALAHELAKHDVELFLVARSRAALNAAAKTISLRYKVRVTAIAQDLTTTDGIDNLLAHAGIKSVNILVNNAGIGDFGHFETVDWSLYERTLQLNTIALTRLTHELLPGMLATKSGKIVNICSTTAFQPLPWMSVYAASKSYVLSFSQALEFELRKTAVDVLTFCPGATSTGFAAAVNSKPTKGFSQSSATTAEAVAERLANLILTRGKRGVVVDGLVNSLRTFLAPKLPRSAVLRAADRAMRPAASAEDSKRP